MDRKRLTKAAKHASEQIDLAIQDFAAQDFLFYCTIKFDDKILKYKTPAGGWSKDLWKTIEKWAKED